MNASAFKDNVSVIGEPLWLDRDSKPRLYHRATEPSGHATNNFSH